MSTAIHVEAEFKRLAGEWDRHCQSNMFSSNIEVYLDHESFPALVKLGRGALPLIVQRYRSDDDARWGFLLEEITGAGISTNRDVFSPAEMKEKWLRWWEEFPQSSSGA